MKFIIEAFENELKESLNSDCVVAVSSGWAALYASLLCCDVKGYEVITTPFTFQATTNVIIQAGGIPVFVDIKMNNHLIDERLIERAITDKTKAILPVHLFGRECNMPEIIKIARKHKLYVIEDTAQAFLRKYSNYDSSSNGKRLGTFGDFGCFSFYCTKNLSTFEGGAISINGMPSYVENQIRAIISHGQYEKYDHRIMGFNGRMSPQSALTGYAQLKLHQNQIEYALGQYSERNGYYPYVTYEHDFIKDLGITGNCPIAEGAAKSIKNKF
jgi:dTDP-4-amino-4,6-dideoxygalactose transaminase